ncbi:VanW family protein [Heyndrickxia acidicola]|uniref:VanW family protein n=1 Tax=Heyndrickxia acidicola TaxID=209389 RepID=A0ABU6MBA8_9BACI|nr:VanW family protein [Heyndrickxia acidicola]MED1201667.1 VanW family protein [Heyndrickxia acidicola]
MKSLVSLLLGLVISQPGNMILQHNGDVLENIHRSDYDKVPFEQMMVDTHKLQTLLNRLEKKVYVSPLNATVDSQGKLISEKAGQRLDRKEFIHQFYSYYYQKGQTILSVPLKTIYPKVDSELLSSIQSKQIGQYITYFNSLNKERTHNIQLAATAINGQTVLPGETFSFNKTVGKRTSAKGYLKAPVIVRGELSEGIGGGICQVSSTLFNAVDRVGVTIVERFSHSRSVPYVPPKRDATVSWYGADFVFKNPYSQPILIRANVYGGQLIVRILSSEELVHHSKSLPDAPSKLPVEILSDKQ